MNVQPTGSLVTQLNAARDDAAKHLRDGQTLPADQADDAKLRETFNQFVGETFFTQLIKSMRSSLGKPAYFHGGRAEEVFQGQLDQMLSEQFAKNSAEQFAEPMYELFQLQRPA